LLDEGVRSAKINNTTATFESYRLFAAGGGSKEIKLGQEVNLIHGFVSYPGPGLLQDPTNSASSYSFIFFLSDSAINLAAGLTLVSLTSTMLY